MAVGRDLVVLLQLLHHRLRGQLRVGLTGQLLEHAWVRPALDRHDVRRRDDICRGIFQLIRRLERAHEAVFERDDVHLLMETLARMTQRRAQLFQCQRLRDIRPRIRRAEQPRERAAEWRIREETERAAAVTPEDQHVAIGRAHPRCPLEESVKRVWIGGVAFRLQPGAFADDTPPHIWLAAEIHLYRDVDLFALYRERRVDDLVELAIGLLIEQRTARRVVGDHVDHHGPRPGRPGSRGSRFFRHLCSHDRRDRGTINDVLVRV